MRLRLSPLRFICGDGDGDPTAMIATLSALLLAFQALAHPHPEELPQLLPHSTHRVRALVDGKPITSYHPPSTFEVRFYSYFRDCKD